MSLDDLLGQWPVQDYVVIGNDVSPGKATIVYANSPRGWDIRKGYAFSGATVVPKGDELSEVHIMFELWSALDYEIWKGFAKKYFDKSARLIAGSFLPLALGIAHPVLNSPPLSISEVVVKDATPLVNDGYGLWSCVIMFLQYRKPKPALAKPVAAIPAISTPQPTAQDSADREISAKLAELQALAGP